MSRLLTLSLLLTLTSGVVLAEDRLEADWLFQVDGQPTSYSARQEIVWARELAARLTQQPNAPDLSQELAELDQIERRLPPTAQPVAATEAVLSLPNGLVARWSFDAETSDIFSGTHRIESGIHGGGLSLSGGGVLTTDAALTSKTNGPYTISVWLRTTADVVDLLGAGVSSGEHAVQ